MKNNPSKISYTNNRKKRNMWLFDAGLHTLNMKRKKKEWDMDFVERFLIKYFEGCRNRGGKKYKDFFMWHKPGRNYIDVLGVK